MFSNRTEYAIRALRELAISDELKKSEDIAENQRIPPKFLPHILSDLARAGIVKTSRGYGGGIELNRPPKEISFKSIVDAVQGPIVTYDCLVGIEDCDMSSDCTLKPIWKKLQHAVEEILESTTLDDLVNQNRSEV